MKKNKIEILAPAGGEEALTAAVRSGADAVYLGSQRFSARSSAHNFDDEQLKNAVAYCHENGVDVHLAVNTLVRDDELGDAMELVKYACSVGVDALIVQDMGVISLIRKSCPDMPIHASTQLSVHTLKGVEMLARLGVQRVVLSRELSFEEIALITKHSPVEIEVFVHGALCMCVSGQCYFSAMLGSRSGNRGQCAQPCRLPFLVRGGTGHDLSLKDLSVIEHLSMLQQAGVASAKIEGRMKRPEYVAAATAACRQCLDSGSADAKLMENLQAVFSRTGFTSGYFDGKTGRDMFGIRSKDDVGAADKKVFSALHELYKRERQHVPVKMHLEVPAGAASTLSASDDRKNTVTVKGSVPERAEKVALDYDRAERSLAKTGGTPYYLESLECEIGEGLTVAASSLGAMRNEALAVLSEKRSFPRPVSFSGISSLNTEPHKAASMSLRARFPDGNVPDEFLDCELIYVPLFIPDKAFDRLLSRGFAVAAEIPRGMFGIEKSIQKRLRRVQELGVDEVLTGNVGAVQSALELGMLVHGGFGLNITNTQSLAHFRELGLIDAELSFELTLQQISAIGDSLPRGIITYGRLPLMLTRNCPAQNDGRGCKHCSTPPVIRDRKGIEFPMQCFGACTEILNSTPLTLADRRQEISGADFEVLRFSTENGAQRAEMLRRYISGKTPDGGHTRGLYYRGVY